MAIIQYPDQVAVVMATQFKPKPPDRLHDKVQLIEIPYQRLTAYRRNKDLKWRKP